MADAKMTQLGKRSNRLWYADRTFIGPGLWLWFRGKNRRIVPLPRWLAK